MIRAGKRLFLTLWVVSVGGIVVGSGCATDIGEDASVRREALESRMRDWGVADAPAVKAKRAELDAAIAHESDSPILDSIEVRANGRYEGTDEKLKMLVRLPVEDYLGASADRAARRAETEVRLAQLGEVALKHRVRTCVPELEQLVHAERMKHFRSYVKRQQAIDRRSNDHLWSVQHDCHAGSTHCLTRVGRSLRHRRNGPPHPIAQRFA